MTDEEIEVAVDTAIKKGFKSPTREYIINDVCSIQ